MTGTTGRIWLCAAVCAGLMAVPAGTPALAGTASEVVFTDYTALSSNTALARRLVTPLMAARLPQLLASAGEGLKPQPVDLSQESFLVYMPSGPPPPAGYGLIVYVPPWEEARMPDAWGPVLDQYGMLFVTPARSGNTATVLGRREPLATLAEQNMVERYRVDPARVYIAGFSGGSRVAMRIALGYPDLFHGAILNSGSDPIGTSDAPIPPPELFREFQETTQIVFVTGNIDTQPFMADESAMASMREFCMFNTQKHVMWGKGHVSAAPEALSQALDSLLHAAPPDPARLSSCRAKLGADVAAELDQVHALITSGDRNGASQLLKKIDEHFGNLATPESEKLSAQLQQPQ